MISKEIYKNRVLKVKDPHNIIFSYGELHDDVKNSIAFEEFLEE